MQPERSAAKSSGSEVSSWGTPSGLPWSSTLRARPLRPGSCFEGEDYASAVPDGPGVRTGAGGIGAASARASATALIVAALTRDHPHGISRTNSRKPRRGRIVRVPTSAPAEPIATPRTERVKFPSRPPTSKVCASCVATILAKATVRARGTPPERSAAVIAPMRVFRPTERRPAVLRSRPSLSRRSPRTPFRIRGVSRLSPPGICAPTRDTPCICCRGSGI